MRKTTERAKEAKKFYAYSFYFLGAWPVACINSHHSPYICRHMRIYVSMTYILPFLIFSSLHTQPPFRCVLFTFFILLTRSRFSSLLSMLGAESLAWLLIHTYICIHIGIYVLKKIAVLTTLELISAILDATRSCVTPPANSTLLFCTHQKNKNSCYFVTFENSFFYENSILFGRWCLNFNCKINDFE